MQLPGRMAELPPSSFAMLATLLDPEPHPDKTISLSVGDPRGVVPAFVTEAIAKHAHKKGLTLKQAGIELGLVDEKTFDRVVKADKMIGR